MSTCTHSEGMERSVHDYCCGLEEGGKYTILSTV